MLAFIFRARLKRPIVKMFSDKNSGVSFTRLYHPDSSDVVFSEIFAYHFFSLVNYILHCFSF